MLDIEAQGTEVQALLNMPSLYFDEAELLSCYQSIRRGTPGGFNGMEPISVQGIEAAYRMLRANEWTEPKEFMQIMFELDSITLEHYSKTQKARSKT